MSSPHARQIICAGLVIAATSVAVRANIIHANDYNGGSNGNPYSFVWPSTSGSSTFGINSNGTIDSHNGGASGALFLNANFSSASGTSWSAGVSTNQIDVTNSVTNTALLNIGFDLLASRALPVKVVLRSYTSAGALTGRSEAIVVPPIANAYFRYGLDVSLFTQAGASAFNPTSARYELTVEIAGANGNPSAWPKTANNILRLDNISYTSPKYYVSPSGNNGWPGTFAQPLRTIKEAVNRAVPGDVIVVRSGTYTGEWSSDPTVTVAKAGSPARWISIRNYPGENPLLQTRETAWNNILINHQAAYIEVRGLTVRGNVSAISLAQAEANENNAVGYYNANGISVDSRFSAGSTPAPGNQRAHHIRIIGNTVHDNCGGGISAIESDYITIAGNLVYRNSWWTRYATSGISIFHAWNLHSSGNNYRMFVVGNNVHDNRCFIKWGSLTPPRISDGNGVILDDFINSQASSTIRYQLYSGRSLVQNNIAWYNGGSGLHTFKANRVVFANNTAFLNNQSPELNWGQIFANAADDVQIVNNMMYSATGRQIDGTVNSTNVVKQYNQYYRAGGSGSAPAGTGNTWATGNWEDAFSGDFRLKSNSAARNSGSLIATGAPRIDIVGSDRPLGAGIDRGAFEFVE